MTTIFYETWPVANLIDRDGISLAYEPSWEQRASAFPISLTIPLRSGTYGAEQVMPWLANLLPETHLSEIGQQLKVSPQDIVGLLTRLGRDTAGAFSIGEPRRDGNNFRIVPDEAALERILNELPERPFLVGEQGVSMSLAGVQDKLPVYLGEDGKIAIPVDGTPSTHILKPDIRRLTCSVQNEAFCMTLARPNVFPPLLPITPFAEESKIHSRSSSLVLRVAMALRTLFILRNQWECGGRHPDGQALFDGTRYLHEVHLAGRKAGRLGYDAAGPRRGLLHEGPDHRAW